MTAGSLMPQNAVRLAVMSLARRHFVSRERANLLSRGGEWHLQNSVIARRS